MNTLEAITTRRSIRRFLENQVLTAIIALGYASDTPACPKRKGVQDLLRYI